MAQQQFIRQPAARIEWNDVSEETPCQVPTVLGTQHSVCYCYLIWRLTIIRINVIFFYVTVFLEIYVVRQNSGVILLELNKYITSKPSKSGEEPRPGCGSQPLHRLLLSPAWPHNHLLLQPHLSCSWDRTGYLYGRPLWLLFPLLGSFSFLLKCHPRLFFKSASNHIQSGCHTPCFCFL